MRRIKNQKICNIYLFTQETNDVDIKVSLPEELMLMVVGIKWETYIHLYNAILVVHNWT